jgi:hypothetical protein
MGFAFVTMQIVGDLLGKLGFALDKIKSKRI